MTRPLNQTDGDEILLSITRFHALPLFTMSTVHPRNKWDNHMRTYDVIKHTFFF